MNVVQREGLEVPEDLARAVVERVAGDGGVLSSVNGDRRAAVRLAVARALAAEGVVVKPAKWAAMVSELVERVAGAVTVELDRRDVELLAVAVTSYARTLSAVADRGAVLWCYGVLDQLDQVAGEVVA